MCILAVICLFFFMDKLSKVQRSINMKAVKSKGTKIEIALGKALWAKGFRYRKNDKTVFGKPDFSFKKIKIAIFVDGEFWHGKDWEIKKYEHKSNQEFWFAKIESNIKRDIEVNKYLSENGWKVFRFWGDDIKKNIYFCIEKIEKGINESK